MKNKKVAITFLLISKIQKDGEVYSFCLLSNIATQKKIITINNSSCYK